MKKLFSLLLAALLLLPILSGCGRTAETKVRLSEVTHSIFYAPQYAAMELGYFDDEHLDVELTNGGGADKVMTALVSGQADIGLAGPEACVYLRAQGKADCPLVFAQLTARDGSFLVGRSAGDFRWEDLRGKTILGGRKGGMPEMTLEYVMAQNGVEPGRDATVDTSVQFNLLSGAFTGGQGDYVALFEPVATELELAGKGHILCSIGEESGEIPYTAYFAAESLLHDRPDIIQRFTTAIARAQSWVQSHSDAEVAQVIAPHFPDTELSVLEQVVARYRAIGAWCATPVMSPEPFQRLQQVMLRAGVIAPEDLVDFHTLVENRFAQEAVQ